MLAAHRCHESAARQLPRDANKGEAPLLAILEHVWEPLIHVVGVVREIPDVRRRAREQRLDVQFLHERRCTPGIEEGGMTLGLHDHDARIMPDGGCRISGAI